MSRKEITNYSVCLERLQSVGFPRGLTTGKDFIASHKHLIPAKRQLLVPQGNRGRWLTTEPGEASLMDWRFTKVVDYDGSEYNVTSFAMVCHHFGQTKKMSTLVCFWQMRVVLFLYYFTISLISAEIISS